MSKIIKKQFKRSLPWFLILSLFSTLVVGTFFNFKFDLNPYHFGFNQPEVKANSDQATTTVVIMNAAPNFAVTPFEIFAGGGSTSTQPVNASSSISFGGTASDPENNNYYLIVCANNTTPTPGAGGTAPSCSGGAANTFCVGASTASNASTSCTYAVATSTLPEIVQWYAFVCDNHATQAACSSYSQGSGFSTGATSSSPFYVNHRPNTINIYTSGDNKDPGGTFTVQASSTDPDVTGPADSIILHICNTNSWSVSTGCGGALLCSATSTTNPSCNFTIGTPKAHGVYSYYAFTKDSHDLGALNNPYPSTVYHVNDVAPSVGSVTLNSGAPITVNLKGANEIVITASSTVSDQNECADLVLATSTIKYAAATSTPYDCSANDNNCYKTTGCSITGCVASSANAYVMCTTTITFHADPTDAGYSSNPYKDGDWRAQIGVHDASFYSYGTTTTGIELNTTTGLDVTQSLIDYGTLQATQNSGSVNATTTIVNYGNSPLNTNLTVSNMATGTNPQIPDSSQQWGIGNFTYGSGTPGSSTTPATADITCAKPTDKVTPISANIYWGLAIPSYIPSGSYSGQNTFSAVVDNAHPAEW